MPRIPYPILKMAESVSAMQHADDNVELILGSVRDIKQQLARLAKKDNAAVPIARAFVVLRQLKDRFKEIETEFNKVYEEAATVILPATIEASGQNFIPLTDGFRVGLSSTIRASIPPDKRSEAWQWLRDNNLGALITETVNASTLSATAKTLLEDEARDLPPELFNVQAVQNTSVTKINPKK